MAEQADKRVPGLDYAGPVRYAPKPKKSRLAVLSLVLAFFTVPCALPSLLIKAERWAGGTVSAFVRETSFWAPALAAFVVAAIAYLRVKHSGGMLTGESEALLAVVLSLLWFVLGAAFVYIVTNGFWGFAK